MLKRTLLRKDPTFDEANSGFRSFGELLRNLAERNVVQLREGAARGDPEVDFPQGISGEDEAFDLLRSVVAELGSPHLAGLKNQVRKRSPGFSEKRFGYGGFLQFCKAAQAKGFIEMELDEEADDYVLRASDGQPAATAAVEADIAAAKPAPRRRSRSSAKRTPRAKP
jgi:hypothetical protein